MANHIIEIEGFQFKPERLELKRENSVSWINKDGVGHSAERTLDPAFDTGELGLNEQSAQLSFVDSREAEIEYFCGPHPHMVGKIILVD